MMNETPRSRMRPSAWTAWMRAVAGPDDAGRARTPVRMMRAARRPGSALLCVAAALALSACAPAVLLGGGAAVGHSVVQERSTLAAVTDTETSLSIATRLGEASGELYRDVNVDVVEGRVLLTGSVPRTADRTTAEQVAWSAVGVRAVTNELTVAEDAGIAAYWSDVGISTRVRYALIRAQGVNAVDYNIETAEGVVHITGLAGSTAALERAVDAARSVPGVRRVVSHVLLIDDPRRGGPGFDVAASKTAVSAGQE